MSHNKIPRGADEVASRLCRLEQLSDVNAYGNSIIRCFRGYRQSLFVFIDENPGLFSAGGDLDGRHYMVRGVRNSPRWIPRLTAAFSTSDISDMRQIRADFEYDLVGSYVAVMDNDGQRSVTNDAEAVVRELAAAGIDLERQHIVYRDTMGVWDGMLTREVAGVHRFVTFVPLRQATLQGAMDAMGRFMIREDVRVDTRSPSLAPVRAHV